MANEKRLIDANDAVKLLRGKCVAKYPSTFLMGIFASADEISKMPTVDAVEVVRCKDCKYRKRPLFAGTDIYCDENRRHFKLDDFCSYGERKGNENND